MVKLVRKLEVSKVHAPSPGEITLLSACDTGYLDYAVRLILSVEVFSPGINFALHVVNPSAEARNRLVRLQSRLSHTRLWISYERVDLSDFTRDQRRVYYASVRFLRLAELMQKWENDFLVLDSDALVVNPLEGPFSQESEAQISLLRRDLGDEKVPDHLAVAAGTVWLRNAPVVREFTSRLATELQVELESGEAGWFMDQRILGKMVRDQNSAVKVGSIDKRYVDWNFADESVIWQAKGDRKRHDIRFLLISQMLNDDQRVVNNALPLVRMLLDWRKSGASDALLARILRLCEQTLGKVVILLPRLDLPWGKPPSSSIPTLANDTLELRLHWVRFVTLLANACEKAGANVEIVQVPAWEINRSLVDSLGASLVLVPHRCSHDFEFGSTPVLFYMQEYFRWMFVVDSQGWSAAASIYPVTEERRAKVDSPGAYEYYRAKLASGDMPSKFAQPSAHRACREASNSTHKVTYSFGRGLLRWLRRPATNRKPPKVFFPLQIRHDQSIQYFSDYAFDDVLQAVIDWGERRGVEIHLKPHPANPKLMQEYLSRHPQTTWLRWRDENVHDLISECDAVFLVNSGVGFEALLHAKPIVIFGRAEYDCVAIRGNMDDIDAAWDLCRVSDPKRLAQDYGQFFDWFTTEFAVDMSREEVCDRRLKKLATEIVSIARVQPVLAVANLVDNGE